MNQTAANAIALAAATEGGQIEEYLTGLRSQRHTQDVEWAVGGVRGGVSLLPGHEWVERPVCGVWGGSRRLGLAAQPQPGGVRPGPALLAPA